MTETTMAGAAGVEPAEARQEVLEAAAHHQPAPAPRRREQKPFQLSAEDRAMLERFQAWCFKMADERSRWGREIVLQRCSVCGAQEYVDRAGRFVMTHEWAKHAGATTVDADAFEIPRPKKAWGMDDELERERRRTFGERD